MEEPVPHGATDRDGRRPHADSHDGAGESVDTSRPGDRFCGPESVDTSREIAGFAFDSLGRPRPRTGIPAAFRYSPTLRTSPRARWRASRVMMIASLDMASNVSCSVGSQRLSDAPLRLLPFHLPVMSLGCVHTSSVLPSRAKTRRPIRTPDSPPRRIIPAS